MSVRGQLQHRCRYKALWHVFYHDGATRELNNRLYIDITPSYCILVFSYPSFYSRFMYDDRRQQIVQRRGRAGGNGKVEVMEYANASLPTLIDMTTGISFLFTKLIAQTLDFVPPVDLFTYETRRDAFVANDGECVALLSGSRRILEYKFSSGGPEILRFKRGYESRGVYVKKRVDVVQADRPDGSVRSV